MVAKPSVKRITNNKKMSNKEKSIKEMEQKIESMKKDLDKKCRAAKEQLVSMLEITVDKYRTATGTAEALRVLRFTKGEDNVPILMANTLAYDMAKETKRMMDKTTELDYKEMDNLCDGFYEKDFKMNNGNEDASYYYQLAFEMMRIDLCRNVGGSAEDMVEFIERAERDIEDTQKALDELKNE